MLTEVLATLATTASSGLVAMMVEDGWQEAKKQVARLLGRGDPAEETRQEARLERSRQELLVASGQGSDLDLDPVRERQSVAWRTRFEDLLEETPEAAVQLRELVEFLSRTSSVATAGSVQVNARASDHAQQAVQGQGVQANTFTAAGPQATPPSSPSP